MLNPTPRLKALLAVWVVLPLLACTGAPSPEADAELDALSSPGLAGEYFANAALSGTALKRTDATVDFNWGSHSPMTGIGADHFSVRWTGYLTPKYSETYQLSTLSDDGVRLWVNGKELVNDWADHSAKKDTGTIALTAGQPVSIRLEYYENAGQAQAQLSWSSAHQASEVIPASALSTQLTSPGNLLSNPSFESNTAGWVAWQGVLSRVALSGAPSGSYVAKVAPAAGQTAYSLDDAPDTVPSAKAGAAYTAGASLRAASTSAIGKTVSLILREKTSSGSVQLWTKDVQLTNAFQSVTVSGTVQTTGHTVDVYLYQENAAASDAFYADALSLVGPSSSSGGGTADAGTPSGSNPSGVAMPEGNVVSNGITWKPVFSDDFTQPAALGQFLNVYGKQWGAYGPGWSDTSKNGIYDQAKTTSVTDGMLDIYVHTENGIHYVSAPTPSIPYGKTYGRYAVRFKADSVAGYKTAWLLWPDSGQWPSGGEVDFPEGDLNGSISAYMHYADPNGGQNAFEHLAQYGGSGWHTAVTEWSAGKIVFMLDGKVVGTSTHEVPSNPMHYVLQTETSLGGAAPSDSASGHVAVDWIVIYGL